MAGFYAVSSYDIAQIVECHCAGMLPLSANGGFVDPNAHIIPHAIGYGTAENAAYIDELHEGCQSETCTYMRQGMAQSMVYEPLCLGLMFIGGACKVSAAEMAEADMRCSCAQAADRGAKMGESLMDNLFTMRYSDYLDAMCAYDECHDLVEFTVGAMDSIDDEWQMMMGMNGIKNCGTGGSAVGAVVGILIGVLCLLGTVGSIVAIVVVLAKQRRRPNAPNAQPITGMSMATATSTTVDAVPVATAVSIAPVPTATPTGTTVVATATPVAAYSTA